MRAVIDATALLGPRTGIGRYTASLLAALPAAAARRGLDAQLDVMTWTARGARLTGLPDGITQVGPRVPARLLRAAWMHTNHPTAELLVGRCDVVHGTNFVSPPCRSAREVVSVHDLTYELLPETVSAASLGYQRLVRRSVARGAHVLTLTEAGAAATRDFYGLPDDQVSAAFPGVDATWALAAPVDDEWLAARGLPSEYILFVGSLDPRKNLQRLIAAHARARAANADIPPLLLAGPAGRDSMVSPTSGVHLTGWLDETDLQRVVARAAALALPSLDEGFGLPALEAMACGRPVTTTDSPVMREVTGGLAHYADPLDEESIADAIVRGVADVDPAAAARRAAFASLYTWQRCADRTLAVYLGSEAPGGEPEGSR